MTEPTIPLVERLRTQAARHREHATGLASAALLEEAADEIECIRGAAPSPEVPEPVYNAVERILDEKSAWVARPNSEVTFAIAVAATLAAMDAVERMAWRPIETAPRECPIDRSLRPGFGAWTTETMWVRDASGRVFEAWFVEVGAYWWDADGECDCEPVEWMPHPLWTPEG